MKKPATGIKVESSKSRSFFLSFAIPLVFHFTSALQSISNQQLKLKLWHSKSTVDAMDGYQSIHVDN